MLPRSSTNARSGRADASCASPAHRTGRHRGALRRVVQRAADQCVGSIAPRAERADHEAGVRRRGQILRRVHGDVGPTIEHGLLNLLDEHPLAADHVQRDVLATISGRLDEHELGVGIRSRYSASATRLSLTTCLGTAPRGQPQRRPRTVGSVIRSLQVEQVAYRGGVALALRRTGVVTQSDGRLVEELGDDGVVNASTASRWSSSSPESRLA